MNAILNARTLSHNFQVQSVMGLYAYQNELDLSKLLWSAVGMTHDLRSDL